MDNGRLRRMTTIAGLMSCLIAATSYGQDTSVATPPTTGAGAQPTTGTAGGPPFDTTAMAAPLMEDTAVSAGDDDSDFPWGLLGLLGLLGLFKRGGGTTVVTRESYGSPPSGTRPGRTTPTSDDRTMNLNPRPGEGGGPDPRR